MIITKTQKFFLTALVVVFYWLVGRNKLTEVKTKNYAKRPIKKEKQKTDLDKYVADNGTNSVVSDTSNVVSNNIQNCMS